MDVDSIPLGTNFVKVLGEEVAKCDALLAIIGPGWLDARDEKGSRRLENPDDFVRIEIGTALKRGIRVIPVLLEGTRVPKADQLPDDLKELALRNGLDIRHASFPGDMERLIRGLTGGSRQQAAPVAPLSAAGVYLRTKARMQLPDPKAYGIKITTPSDKDHVDVADVKGKITRNPPENYKLMVLRIYPKDGNAFYPLKPEVRIEEGGKTWIANSCVVGGPTVSADQLKIGIYLVGPSGRALINYFRDAERTHNENKKLLKPGTQEKFRPLPHIRDRTNDMLECHEVFVFPR
jgi:hypothetical protein